MHPALKSLSLLLLGTSLLGSTARAQLVEVPTPNLGAACDDLDAGSILTAIDRELPSLSRRPTTERWRFGALDVSVADYVQKTLKPLEELARQGTPALCAALPVKFRFFRDKAVAQGKFTIYNNPIVRASRTRHAPFLYPIYKRPPGALASLTSGQIIDGGLDGKGLELAYLDDPIVVMRMHIEGSASANLDDGTMMTIGTDGGNGQTYATMHTGEGIKELKKGLPALWAYWRKNPKYVYFKEKNGIGGGKFGELTPGRSLAIDPTTIPHGAATWIRADKPGIVEHKLSGWYSYGRIALTQDTGSAIKGAGRVDVFFGTGEYADDAAKQAARPGELYMLLAK